MLIKQLNTRFAFILCTILISFAVFCDAVSYLYFTYVLSFN